MHFYINYQKLWLVHTVKELLTSDVPLGMKAIIFKHCRNFMMQTLLWFSLFPIVEDAAE